MQFTDIEKSRGSLTLKVYFLSLAVKHKCSTNPPLAENLVEKWCTLLQRSQCHLFSFLSFISVSTMPSIHLKLCEIAVESSFTYAPCCEGKCSVDSRSQAGHQKMEIPSLAVFLLFSLFPLVCVRLPQRLGQLCTTVEWSSLNSSSLKKRGKHSERHMQMRGDRKAECTQAAARSSHSYEMSSSDSSQSFVQIPRVMTNKNLIITKKSLKIHRRSQS